MSSAYISAKIYMEGSDGMIRLTLDVYLNKIGMSRYRLAKLTRIGFPTIDAYYKNKLTRYDGYILDQICGALNCELSDILHYEKDAAPTQNK